MDVCEAVEEEPRKHSAVETIRPPLGPAEKNNAAAIRRPRIREVTSRYKSNLNLTATTPSSLSTPSGPRRCPSPNTSRNLSSSSQLVPKRAQSAERKRPCTPPSPTSPSTDAQFSSRRLITGRSVENLWPCTMRSLSVSFQSDTYSLPVSRREKPAPHTPTDRTLKPSSNVGHKQQAEAASQQQRKPTPDRKRSPFKGKNAPDQSENSKPVDGLHTRLVDQHRWPSRASGKVVSSNALTRSVDLTDKPVKRPPSPPPGSGFSSLRRIPTSNLDQSGRIEIEGHPSAPRKLVSSSSSEKIGLNTPVLRSQSLPNHGARPPSPNKTSRGVSPSRLRPSTPPSRGTSPSRIRPSSTSTQPISSTSVLSFIADYRKGKKGASHIEDAHSLRLFHNRYLQWRFANAQADFSLYFQTMTTEKLLYNVWSTTEELWESVTTKRINLQQLKLELKLNFILNEQMAYLNDWALLERDHFGSLSGAIEDLQASTLRVPVTGGARADIETVKGAVCSAVNVMQAMGSSTQFLLSKMEDLNCLVSELASLAAEERAMLDECEALLASTAIMQIEEYSLTTHLIQLKQALKNSEVVSNPP